VTIAIRSLFTSDTSIIRPLEHVNVGNGNGNGMGEYGDDLTEDIDVAYGLGTKWHGMQFRIRAVVMMMMGHVHVDTMQAGRLDDDDNDDDNGRSRGIPLHSTPVSTVNSSILHPWGEKAKENGGDVSVSVSGTCTGESKDGDDNDDGNDDGNDYILKEEDGKSSKISIDKMVPMVTSTHCCTWDRTVTTSASASTSTSANNNSRTSTRQNQSGVGGGRGGGVNTGAGSNTNIDRSNVLILPIRYKDIQRGTFLKLELITTPTGVSRSRSTNGGAAGDSGGGGRGSRVVSCATLPLWDETGVLKTGLQRVPLAVHMGGYIPVSGGATTGRKHHNIDMRRDEKWEASLIMDKLQKMEKDRDRQQDMQHSHGSIHTGRNEEYKSPLALESVPWLDAITKQRCLDILQEDVESVDNMDQEEFCMGIDGDGNVNEDGNGNGNAVAPYALNANATLIVELPECNIPIVHEEHLYTDKDMGVSGSGSGSVGNTKVAGASGTVTALDLSLYHHECKEREEQLQEQKRRKEQAQMKAKTKGKEQQLAQSEPSSFSQSDVDPKNKTKGKGASKKNDDECIILMPSQKRTSANTNYHVREMGLRAVQILDHESPDGEFNPVEDKYRALHQQHQYVRGLVDPALKPDATERNILHSIIANTSQHLSQPEKDLLWKFRFSLVDNRRALTKFLMAVEWNVESEVVQAAELLEQWRKRSPIEVSDALKLLGKNVDMNINSGKHAHRGNKSCPNGLGLVRAYAIDTLAAAPDAELVLYLLQLVQALKYEDGSANEDMDMRSKSANNTRNSSLSSFLIERASRNLEFASYLYWYLKVELSDPSSPSVQRYRDVFIAMRIKLSTVKCGDHKRGSDRIMWDILAAQDIFISNVMECQNKSRDAKGKKDAKEQHLKGLLTSPQCQSINDGWSVPLPSNPLIWIKGVKAESAKMFKSAMYPALLDFHVDTGGESDGNGNDETYKVIVKTGDDLRQDQLVIMLIKLFDRILKRGALDLCLKPYPIMAMSQDTGLVEFVEGSIPVSQILANHNNSILSFFKSVAPSPGSKYSVNPKAMQTYIRSCAGYCVITYLIGVGDRHLDNLLITKLGHFFHIDFGFIFGRDPKPLPPLFRLTREMVDGMGGIDSDEYRQFCSLACQAFNLLRKRAGLVLNLLHLMSDAGIEDLSNNPSADAEGVISKVEERFRLELNDEQAETYFLGLVNDTLSAIAPRVMDVFHQISVSRR